MLLHGSDSEWPLTPKGGRSEIRATVAMSIALGIFVTKSFYTSLTSGLKKFYLFLSFWWISIIEVNDEWLWLKAMMWRLRELSFILALSLHSQQASTFGGIFLHHHFPLNFGQLLDQINFLIDVLKSVVIKTYVCHTEIWAT